MVIMRKEYYQISLTSPDISDPSILLARISLAATRNLWCAIRANVGIDNKMRMMHVELIDIINNDDELHVQVQAPDITKGINTLADYNMIMVGKYHEIFLNPHYWWFGDPDKRHTARVEWDERKEQQNGGNRWLK
jgi:hypothetical protein